MTIRIVLADDAPDIRVLLRAFLGEDPALEVVAEAVDGIEAVDEVTAHRPDVVLLDLSMPRKDGLEAIPEILAASPETAIVVLSGFLTVDVKAKVMELGATSFVEKGSNLDEVVQAVKSAAAGE